MSDFLRFASYSSATLEMKLVNYFNDARAQTNPPDGSPRYRATTIRSWLSVFSKFWRHCKYKDLKALVPTLEDKIGEWEKKQTEVKQAKCFSREELTTFIEMPTTVDNLLDKAYAAIALSFAAREKMLAFQKKWLVLLWRSILPVSLQFVSSPIPQFCLPT